MKFLLDENIPLSVIRQLRERGHDVLSAKESLRAENDEIVLERAQRESRVVVTQDKDFGELAFRKRLPSSCGIILFRLSGGAPDDEARRMLQAIESRNDWTGQFSVIRDAFIRMRPLK
ncbi:MAG: DUF5615 family PIN-like protein [Candidatus Omnitrophota bacterium]